MPENEVNDSIPTVGELYRRLMALEEKVGTLSESRHESDIWQGQTDLKLDNISDTLTRFEKSFENSIKTMQSDIKAIADKPAKRMDTFVTAAISAGAGGLMGLIISNIAK